MGVWYQGRAPQARTSLRHEVEEMEQLPESLSRGNAAAGLPATRHPAEGVVSSLSGCGGSLAANRPQAAGKKKSDVTSRSCQSEGHSGIFSLLSVDFGGAR